MLTTVAYYIVKPHIFHFSTFELVEQFSVLFLLVAPCYNACMRERSSLLLTSIVIVVDVVLKFAMHVSLLCGCRILNSSPMKLLLYCMMLDILHACTA